MLIISNSLNDIYSSYILGLVFDQLLIWVDGSLLKSRIKERLIRTQIDLIANNNLVVKILSN